MSGIEEPFYQKRASKIGSFKILDDLAIIF